MIELGGRNQVVLGEKSIKVGKEEFPVPNNLHNFFVAGAYAYYGLPYEGEKPPRAVYNHKGARLVLFQSNGRVFLLAERGQERVARGLRKSELRILLDWIREKNRAVSVEEIVFFKQDGFLHLYDLSLSETSRRQLFYALEDALKGEKKFVLPLKEGRVVSDGKRIVFLKAEEQTLKPVGSVKNSVDNLLRIMSVL